MRTKRRGFPPHPKVRKWGTRLADFGHELRGIGGNTTTHVRALKGSTFGPASEGKRLSPEQVAEIEKRMRDEGKI